MDKPPPIIREAVLGDLPELISIGKRFHEKGDLAKISPYDEPSARKTLTALIMGEQGVILVADQLPSVIEPGGARGELLGACGVVVCPNLWNHDCQWAQELFWWCHAGGQGVKLLLKADEWRRKHKASAFMVSTLSKVGDARIDEFLKKRGFTHTETCWTLTDGAPK